MDEGRWSSISGTSCTGDTRCSRRQRNRERSPRPSLTTPLSAAWLLCEASCTKRRLLARIDPIQEQNGTQPRIFIKKCTIGVMINTLLASSYCPSSVVTRETIEFLSPTCGPDEYCPILMIGSSFQKNSPHLVLSKSISFQEFLEFLQNQFNQFDGHYFILFDR
ncbi:hypothetical protein ALC56_03377 [Trachymyrmex septentrionalis]|uniref:Uncharacterized protein n=1 Tax=Trachymyrmex septentrionalis TaxID=34720 RepID=A0A195FQQ4_9HYME|nr:hypothetical protein ALC56_03377 [Trachymyrmex septentrionalis]